MASPLRPSMAGASWHAALPSWIEIATAKKVEVFVSEGLCTDEVLKNQMGKNPAAGRSGEFAFFDYCALAATEPRSGDGSESMTAASALRQPPPAQSASPHGVLKSPSNVGAASLALPAPLRDAHGVQEADRLL